MQLSPCRWLDRRGGATLRRVEHVHRAVGDLVDEREAVREEGEDVLRRNRTVAAVVRPQKSVVVVELHALQTRHRSQRSVCGSR